MADKSCSRKMHNNKKPSETIFCRDYKNYTAESLKDDLKNTDFSTVYMEENPNNSWKNLKNILLKTFNKHAPIISKRVKGKKSPWLTTSIKKEMNSRDLLHRKFRKSRCQTDYDTYRIQRNKVNVIVRKAKNKHYKSMLNESSNDPRRFWRTLKQIFPVKETVTNAKSFFINGVLESKPARIASIFCKFFTNMAVKVKATSIRLKDFVWSTPVQIHSKTYSTFRFKEVLVSDVFKHLKKLSRNKATGYDDLPPGLLKDSAQYISRPLTHVINSSLTTSVIPEDFKIGIITPIYKSGVKSDLDNYRPVTVLPVCSKILEKCIHSQVSKFLEEKNILSETQFGFRKQRNTELAATLFLDEVRENMNRGEMTGVIFVDLSKAFDSLGHAQILKNLPSYGIHGREQQLFANYLFNRKQAVRFDREISEFHDVTCGVPQGSILGPLLFLLTFDNVESVLRHSKIITYADDTVIYVSEKSKRDIEVKLNEDFCALVAWLESMHLVCNMTNMT